MPVNLVVTSIVIILLGLKAKLHAKISSQISMQKYKSSYEGISLFGCDKGSFWKP